MEFLFILGRALFGGYFLMNAYNHFKNHGALTGYAQSKGVPMASVAVYATGVILGLGGLGILLGVRTGWAVLLLSVFLIGTTYQMHQYWKVTDPMMRMGERINFYKNIALLGGLLMTLAIPTPWSMSLITWLF